MQTTDGKVEFDSELGHEEHKLFTYSEEEREENQINKENSTKIFSPEFIPYYSRIAKDYNLSCTEALIYGFIRFYMNNGNGRFYFTNEQIASMLCCSENTINISINNISSKGLITKQTKIRSGGGTIRFISSVKVPVSENGCSEYQKTDSHSIRKLIANKNKIKENKINNIYTSDFLSWYQLYPIKKSKGSAEKAWKKVPREAIPQIMEATKKYAASGTDPKYMKHPATWLNGKCWEDEDIKQEKAKNGDNIYDLKIY